MNPHLKLVKTAAADSEAVLPTDPFEALQQSAVVARHQLLEAFEVMAKRFPQAGKGLEEPMDQVLGVLNMFENNVLVMAFRAGRLNFSDGPSTRPT